MVVEHFHARHHGNAAPVGFFAKTLFVGNVEIAAMAGGDGIEPVAESVLQELERSLTDPESEETRLVLGDLGPGNLREPFFAAQAAARHEAAEIPVSLVMAREEHHRRAVVHGDLRPDDEMYSQLLSLDVRAHDAVDPVAIGDGERAKPEAVGFFHELFGMTGPLEKGAIGFTEERNVGEGRHSTQRRRGAETQRKIGSLRPYPFAPLRSALGFHSTGFFHELFGMTGSFEKRAVGFTE
jgi:hypothetical protein